MPKKAEKLNIAIDKYVSEVYEKHTPKYSWYMALTEAGYSKSYVDARTADLWKRAESRIQERKDRIESKNKWDLDWVDQEYRDLYSECRNKSDNTTAKGVLDSMARRKGGFVDNINSTVDDQSQVMTKSEKQEALRKQIKLLDEASDAGTAVAG